MDPRTQRILAEITARLPKQLSDKLMMDDPLDLKFDAINEELAKSKHVDEKAKKAIALAAKSQKRSQVVNTEIARQIDQWYEREIKRAIDAGILPKPEADRFIQERMYKMRQAQRK